MDLSSIFQWIPPSAKGVLAWIPELTAAVADAVRLHQEAGVPGPEKRQKVVEEIVSAAESPSNPLHVPLPDAVLRWLVGQLVDKLVVNNKQVAAVPTAAPGSFAPTGMKGGVKPQ